MPVDRLVADRHGIGRSAGGRPRQGRRPPRPQARERRGGRSGSVKVLDFVAKISAGGDSRELGAADRGADAGRRRDRGRCRACARAGLGATRGPPDGRLLPRGRPLPMASGRRPFQGQSTAELHLRDPPGLASGRHGAAPRAGFRAGQLVRCLEKDPRQAAAQTAATSATSFGISGVRPRPLPDQPREWTRPPPPRGRLLGRGVAVQAPWRARRPRRAGRRPRRGHRHGPHAVLPSPRRIAQLDRGVSAAKPWTFARSARSSAPAT